MRRALPALALALLLGPAGAARADTPPVVAAGAPTGVVVPEGFHGVSIETWHLAAMARTAPCPSNPFVGALARLGRAGIRIGGNSQDLTTLGRRGGRFTMGAAYFDGMACAAALGGPVEVGLNLRDGDVADVRELMGRAANVVPGGRLAFALGNEADLMKRFGAATGTGATRLARMLAAYRAMRERLPRTASFRGPDFSTGRFRAQIDPWVRAVQPASVSVHAYALSRCRRTFGDPDFPTVDRLAAKAASSGLVDALRPVLAAHAATRPVALTEVNSVACSGQPGVSDHPVSAMWGADLLAAAASAGLAQVRFHLSTGAYDPLVPAPGGRLEARPLFNGMRFAADHLPPGARLLALEGQPPGDVSAWGVAHAGRTTVLLMNHGTTAQAVGVRVGAEPQTDVLQPQNTDPQGASSVSSADVAVEDGVARVEIAPYGAVAVSSAG